MKKNLNKSFKTIQNWQIETPFGFKDFSGVLKTNKNDFIKIETSKDELICSTNHRILTNLGWKRAEDLVLGNLILSKNISQVVLKIETVTNSIDLFDIVGIEDGKSSYYTNDFISHNCEFLGSSGTLIAGWKLKQLVPQIPIQKNDGLSQYEAPIKEHRYALICDVSHGKGLDYSAFHVIDVTEMPYKQVCVFHSNKITPTDYASIIFSIARSYNDALVLIELMDVGYEVASLVHLEHEYENMVMTASFERKTIAVSGFGRYSGSDKGVRTNKSIKAIGCSIVKLLIEQNQLLINNDETIKELSTFSKKNSSYEAEEGCHDDLVMGLVLFGWLTTQDYFREYVSIDTLKNLRDFSEQEIENDLLPFGVIVRGTDALDENRSVIDVVDEFYQTYDLF